MTSTEYEKNKILYSFNIGEISKEETDKLLNDLTPLFWNELHEQNKRSLRLYGG